MRQKTVLVAGATGDIGSRVVRLLASQGHSVRAAVRPQSLSSPRAKALLGPGGVESVVLDPFSSASWTAALEGVDVVVSTLGAPVALSPRGWRSFESVDLAAHRALAAALPSSGAGRVVYLSAETGPGFDQTRYITAHLRAEEALAAAAPSFTAVRPTGIYSALHDFVSMARRGIGMVLGDGTARTNPIHPDDVAEAIVGVLEEGPRTRSIGGPEVMTRADIVRTAFAALGKAPRLVHVPAGFMKAYAVALRPLHPRLGDFIAFAIRVSTNEAVAPAVGTRTLREYFDALASSSVNSLVGELTRR